MKTLIIVDVQNGFCSGGSLAVPDGDSVVPVINSLIEKGGYGYIVASQDWHPANHGSFASQHQGAMPFDMGELDGRPQVMWPDHCVQGTHGAEFHPGLKMTSINHVQRKGLDPLIDSYSAFRDNSKDALTGLHEIEELRKADTLDICGLATDYCVKATAIDAVELLPGVKVRFISDASRGISADTVSAAEREMTAAGVSIITSFEAMR